MEAYWDAMRQKVCRKCIDGDRRGGCRLPAGDECSLEKFFPQIVSTVSSMRTDSFDAYVDALRKNVCEHCEHQLSGAKCPKRDALECALDRYYPVVIDVIETVKYALDEQKHTAA